jgi:hypothetical protein
MQIVDGQALRLVGEGKENRVWSTCGCRGRARLMQIVDGQALRLVGEGKEN